MSKHEPKRLGDKQEVCNILECRPTYLWYLTKSGELTPIRLGRRMTRYDLTEVHALADRWIAEAKAQHAAALTASTSPSATSGHPRASAVGGAA